MRRSYNAYKINQHLSDPSFCYAEAEYLSDDETKSETFDVETKIPLFIGMPVMTIRNRMEKENGYVNGTRGKIVKINKKSIVIQKADGTTLRIEREEFTAKETESIRIKQYPIRVSCGISINKCQGLTFDSPVIINPYCFESGQLYTALSRVRKLSNLYLTDKIPESSLIPNPEADAFMNSIELITADNMHLYDVEDDSVV